MEKRKIIVDKVEPLFDGHTWDQLNFHC